ncbi:MAG: DUF1616 domain-containing protein [Candidatus Bathyarchaeota archaeon]|nr:DUF1616 domain-containing protein [Candidatus Bathyarchaeota archaeon]
MDNKRGLSRDQIQKIVLETVTTEKPETTEKLVALLQTKTALPKKEITHLLLQMESQGTLYFVKAAEPAPRSFQTYLFSKQAAWYWVTIMLALAAAVSAFVIPEAAYPSAYLRSALGVFMVLFLLGYAIVKALYPSKIPFKIGEDYLGGLERFVLSLGLSIVVAPLILMLLNYTPWGIRLTPVVVSVFIIIAVSSSVAVLREFQSKANPAPPT